jgi:hypothetical protein
MPKKNPIQILTLARGPLPAAGSFPPARALQQAPALLQQEKPGLPQRPRLPALSLHSQEDRGTGRQVRSGVLFAQTEFEAGLSGQVDAQEDWPQGDFCDEEEACP